MKNLITNLQNKPRRHKKYLAMGYLGTALPTLAATTAF
jgi:hypothetical protein